MVNMDKSPNLLVRDTADYGMKFHNFLSLTHLSLTEAYEMAGGRLERYWRMCKQG